MADDVSKVQVNQDDYAYSGFLKIRKMEIQHEKFDGSLTPPLIREICHRRPAVAVLPYDPETDSVLLIRQFLIGAHLAGIDNRPLQVVAGMVEEGQTPEEAAIREAQEESGLILDHVIPAQNFLPSPGGSDERLFTYVAIADLSSAGGIHGLEEESEDIRVEVMKADDAIALLDAGKIEAGPAVVTLSWLARKLPELRLLARNTPSPD